MKLNLATVVWLLVGLCGLVGSYAAGVFADHPTVLLVVLGFYKALGSLLGPLATKELPGLK